MCSVRAPDNSELSKTFSARVWSLSDVGAVVNLMFRVFREDTNQWAGQQGVRVDYVLAWP